MYAKGTKHNVTVDISGKCVLYVALLTLATTLSTQSSSTTDKGFSVLSIACDIPVCLVTEYITTIILKELYINFYYYYHYYLYFLYQQ